MSEAHHPVLGLIVQCIRKHTQVHYLTLMKLIQTLYKGSELNPTSMQVVMFSFCSIFSFRKAFYSIFGFSSSTLMSHILLPHDLSVVQAKTLKNPSVKHIYCKTVP